MLMNHKNFHFTQIPDKTNDMIFLKSPKTIFTDRRKDGRKDGQTLFHRTLPAYAGGPEKYGARFRFIWIFLKV